MIMALNFYSLPFMLLRVLHIIDLVLKLPNKMEELRESLNIFWMQAEPSFINLNCQHLIGLMLFYMPPSSSIESHHLTSTINHHLIYFIIKFLMFIVFKSLAQYVTPLLFKHIEQNCMLEQENLCFQVTQLVLKVMFSQIFIPEKYIFPEMSVFMNTFYLTHQIHLQ